MALKEARIKAGKTVLDVAHDLRVSQQAVYQWERGETAPTIANLEKLKKIYGCTVDDLLKPVQDSA